MVRPNFVAGSSPEDSLPDTAEFFLDLRVNEVVRQERVGLSDDLAVDPLAPTHLEGFDLSGLDVKHLPERLRNLVGKMGVFNATGVRRYGRTDQRLPVDKYGGL